MPPRDPGFTQHFKDALVGIETRLRKVETDLAVLTARIEALKNDNCIKHDAAIKELYESRNVSNLSAQQTTQKMEGIGKVVDGHTNECEELSKKLDTAKADLASLKTEITTLSTIQGQTEKRADRYTGPIVAAIIATILSLLTSWAVTSQNTPTPAPVPAPNAAK